MTKIAIVTDSTCDLPADTISRYSIEVIPLYIHMGEQHLLEGVNITKDEFYARLPAYDPAPTTAAPGSEAFREVYQRLVDDGAEAIISIHIYETLSAVVNSAQLAAKEFSLVPVTVLDSGQLSMGLGFIVEHAAHLAQAGGSLSDVLKSLEDLMQRTYVFAALDTLEYLRRSGRMHLALARLGELLRIKPLLHMNQGKATAHRTRTTSKAQRQLLTWLQENAPCERLAVLHAGVPERAHALRAEVEAYWPTGQQVPIIQITPALGAHLGIGALGFACVSRTA